MSKILYFSIVLTIMFSMALSVSFAFDFNLLSNLIREEMKKFINREIQVGQIRFIGFPPKDSCRPERLKIREIKRPSSVEFTFYCAERQYRAIADYEALTTLYISQRTLKRGETISEEDIIEIKRPLNRVPAGSIMKKEELLGKVIKRTISQGLIIKEDHVYSGIPVKRGSKVQVFVTAGQVTVLTEGVLKYDAVVGQRAKIHCVQTGKEIVGDLVDKDKVRVNL